MATDRRPHRPYAVFGQRIVAARKALGIGPSEFARRLGLSALDVWRYEAGERRPREKRLIAISKALGVSLDYLLTGDAPGSSVAAARNEWLMGSWVKVTHVSGLHRDIDMCLDCG